MLDNPFDPNLLTQRENHLYSIEKLRSSSDKSTENRKTPATFDEGSPDSGGGGLPVPSASIKTHLKRMRPAIRNATPIDPVADLVSGCGGVFERAATMR
ncbi:hypothetical protein GWI33_007246 [Rhynchophorus ferrugineus]|uniref:Uncharacterized protein n=1 Tax=Rhynchophorus ferrugineus TaxID=354439 RepID=A0A834IK49_RHYFE|nr:hypothetical protein GWI33_007246 [Rhynchophorus ferrugineus]